MKLVFFSYGNQHGITQNTETFSAIYLALLLYTHMKVSESMLQRQVINTSLQMLNVYQQKE